MSELIPVKTQEELNKEALDVLRAKLSGTEVPHMHAPTQGHIDDIQTIAKALFRAKYKHEWCGEFERTLDAVNEELTVPIKANKRTVWMTVDFTGSIQIPVDVEVPENDDEIKEMVENQDAYFLDMEETLNEEIGTASVQSIDSIDVYNITQNRWGR